MLHHQIIPPTKTGRLPIREGAFGLCKTVRWRTWGGYRSAPAKLTPPTLDAGQTLKYTGYETYTP